MMMTGNTLRRSPEPELMDSPDQVEAYAGANFAESNQWFVDDLVARYRPRPQRGRLIDLGCGPGDICIRLAMALPGWRITGLDAGPNMLDRARQAVQEKRLEQSIRFQLAQLPDDTLEAGCWDCICSNSLLHHLPDPSVLWRTVRRLAGPRAWVQVMDLDRPRAIAEVDRLVERYASDAPSVLRADFRNSLIAAWRAEEVRQQLIDAGLDLRCERVSDRHWLVSGRLGQHAE